MVMLTAWQSWATDSFFVSPISDSPIDLGHDSISGSPIVLELDCP